jgi:(p)ppGpp synthase/HD superfamily hydrolase
MTGKKGKKEATLSPRMYEALELAFKLHGHDTRKSSPVPYIAHLLHVCALVLQDGGEEDEAVAALLHDALEDKPEKINEKKILRRFGERVLQIVKICTDTPEGFKGGPKPPWRERKDAYLKRVSTEPPALLRVTIADKIDNARAILADHHRFGDELWNRFNASKQEVQWYYDASAKAYQKAGASGPLIKELKQLVRKINRL